MPPAASRTSIVVVTISFSLEAGESNTNTASPHTHADRKRASVKSRAHFAERRSRSGSER
jgi:hypothetical protein